MPRTNEFPGAALDRWLTTEPAMPSAGDICTPEQDRHAYSLSVDLKDYREKYGRQALQELMDEALS